MYLVGADHPHKIDARRILEKLVMARRRLVTSTEVFQEILHRYTYIDRRDAIAPAFDVMRGIVDEILPVEEADVLLAKDLVCARSGLSARDALHAAVMQHHAISEIMTFDKRFDQLPGLKRVALPGAPI